MHWHSQLLRFGQFNQIGTADWPLFSMMKKKLNLCQMDIRVRIGVSSLFFFNLLFQMPNDSNALSWGKLLFEMKRDYRSSANLLKRQGH